MDSLLDQVNKLIKMRKGDLYRLEHIKVALEEKRIVYVADRKYVDSLVDKYILNITRDEPVVDNNFVETKERVNGSEEKVEHKVENNEDIEENTNCIFCWKCGINIPAISKFCHKCGADIENPREKTLDEKRVKEKKKQKKKRKEKGEGMSTSKKILIVLVVVFVIITIVVLIVIGAFVSVMSDRIDGTTEKTELFKTMIINESQTTGNLIVDIEKIEFYDKYTKIFLTAENMGDKDTSIYDTSYVKQGTKDFQNIMFQPFGASGEKFDGHQIPPDVTRKGIMFVDTWNSNNEFEIILKYNNWNGGWNQGEFRFNVNPEQTGDSKCGQGTAFDMNTNSCIIP